MQKETLYTVADLAKSCKIRPSAVRYYIQQGLLNPINTSESGYMIFDPIISTEQLKTILEFRKKHMTITEIKNYLEKELG